MTETGTAKILKTAHVDENARLGAFEILYEIGNARSSKHRAAAHVVRVWISVGLAGALLCWWSTADHFTLLRQADAFVSLAVNQTASRNGVINHAIYISSEASILSGTLLIALVWYRWFRDNANTASRSPASIPRSRSTGAPSQATMRRFSSPRSPPRSKISMTPDAVFPSY